MKVEIVYPFIDFRRLSSSKTDLLVKNPIWPRPQISDIHYYRSMGQVYPLQSDTQYDRNRNYMPSCVANGITLQNANISGLKGMNRIIDMKHGTDLFGYYSISFFIQVGTFSNRTVDNIYNYFKNIEFCVKDLVDCSNGLSMENLHKHLPAQFYWATRRLTEHPVDKNIKLYQRDPNTMVNGKNKLFIKTQKTEMRDLVFMKPYFIVEHTTDDKIQDAPINKKFLFFKQTTLTFDARSKPMQMVSIQYPFLEENNPDFKISQKFKSDVKNTFLLFDYLRHLTNYKSGKTDDLLERYFYAITKFCDKKLSDRKQNAIQEVYENKYPNLINNTINNLDSLYGENPISSILDSIYNNVPIPK